VVTEIDDVVSPVDQTKLDPVAVNIELPQLSVTVTIGALGVAVGLAFPVAAELVQPPTV